jgi:hypothetical protein
MTVNEHSPSDAGLCESPAFRSSVEQWSQRKVGKRPLREAVLTIYVTMAILLLAIPQSVSDRIADLPQGGLTDEARRIIAVVSDIAELTGLPRLYESARHSFLKALGRHPRQRPRS